MRQTSSSGVLEPATLQAIAKAICFYPLLSLAVVSRIPLQAFKLWRKRVPFVGKPAPPSEFVTRSTTTL